jgi:hypothetical protein
MIADERIKGFAYRFLDGWWIRMPQRKGGRPGAEEGGYGGRLVCEYHRRVERVVPACPQVGGSWR